MLTLFNAHCDRVRMANIAHTMNLLQFMILTGSPRILLTLAYHVFEMWKMHQGGTLLLIHLCCDPYTQGSVHISLCHVDPNQSATLTCELRGKKTSAAGRVMSALTLSAHSTFENSEAVKPRTLTEAELRLDGYHLTLTLSPA